MNKIITIYELLGLIKDGKAPKKIKYESKIYEFTNYDYLYIFHKTEQEFVEYWLIGNYIQDLQSLLNDKVEILEDKKEELEEIDTTADNTLFTMECYTGIPEQALDWNFKVLKNAINEITKYLKNKENK